MESKKITKVHIIASGILWLLGLLTFLFNLFGLWEVWHLAAFGFVGMLCIIALIVYFALVTIHLEADKETRIKYIKKNAICLLLNICIVVFTFMVSSEWGLARFICGEFI